MEKIKKIQKKSDSVSSIPIKTEPQTLLERQVIPFSSYNIRTTRKAQQPDVASEKPFNKNCRQNSGHKSMDSNPVKLQIKQENSEETTQNVNANSVEFVSSPAENEACSRKQADTTRLKVILDKALNLKMRLEVAQLAKNNTAKAIKSVVQMQDKNEVRKENEDCLLNEIARLEEENKSLQIKLTAPSSTQSQLLEGISRKDKRVN